MRILLSMALAALAACAGDKAPSPSAPSPTAGAGSTDDPCAGQDLPPCPAECSGPVGQLAGQACEAGATCGNEIGDGCTCANGTWDCQPHAPLGGPGTCNRVCRR